MGWQGERFQPLKHPSSLIPSPSVSPSLLRERPNVVCRLECFLLKERGWHLCRLWSVSLGYNQERIVNAATNQMRKLPYCHSFWNHGHEIG
jgi:hypothetical protein